MLCNLDLVVQINVLAVGCQSHSISPFVIELIAPIWIRYESLCFFDNDLEGLNSGNGHIPGPILVPIWSTKSTRRFRGTAPSELRIDFVAALFSWIKRCGTPWPMSSKIYSAEQWDVSWSPPSRYLQDAGPLDRHDTISSGGYALNRVAHH